MAELSELVLQIQDTGLRVRVQEFLTNPPTDLEQPCLPLEVCPAGAYHHHSYPGGLLQHTVCVAELALNLCDQVERHYGGEINRDLVLAGSILHDIMKVYCYEENGHGGFRTSDYGGLVDHLSLMVSECFRRKYPNDLIHVIASHHGDVGSTKPKTLEALIVSVADQADSDFNGKLLRAAEYLLKRTGVYRPYLDSAEAAVHVILTKSREGWDGVQRIVEEENDLDQGK